MRKKKHRCSKVIVVPYVVYRRRRRRLRRASTTADINQSASVNGPVSGLINIIIQIPINAGDATALNDSDNNSVTNLI